MPYIKKEDRTELQESAKIIADHLLNGKNLAGEFNFFISTILGEIFSANKSYRQINELIGALECAKLEFYRRIAAELEQIKIKENGDLPSYDYQSVFGKLNK